MALMSGFTCGIQGESIFFPLSKPPSHNHGVLQMFSDESWFFYLPVTSKNSEITDCASLRLTTGMAVGYVYDPWQVLNLLSFFL